MKRSSQVALLLMGMTTAGASAYALLPPRDCATPGTISPQTLAPGTGPVKPFAPCESGGRSSSGSRSYWSSRSYSRGSSSTPQQSGEYSGHAPPESHTSVPSVGHGPGTRGGFGSIGHFIAAVHTSGG